MGRYLVSAFICVAVARYCLAVNMNDFFPNINNNFTKVTWAHAVNNQALLNDTLRGDVMMIEADIVLGSLINTEYVDKIPIMGHPPTTTSDLSLAMFLKWVLDYNEAAIRNDTGKGIKLDFKSIEVFEASIPILLEVYDKMNFPVWINADILRGPLNLATPVDPERFFNGSKYFSSSVLSIGWTTTYGGIIKNLSYTSGNMDDMLSVIRKQNIDASITFPVRAGMIARSETELQYLMKNMPEDTTITIWSGADDDVDVFLLRKVIFGTGIDNKVFIDVPEDLLSQLDLGNPDLHETLRFIKGDAAYIYAATISVFACLIICLVNYKRY